MVRNPVNALLQVLLKVNYTCLLKLNRVSASHFAIAHMVDAESRPSISMTVMNVHFTTSSSILSSGVEFLEVLRHLFDLSVVVVLDLSDEFGVVWRNEVNCDTFSSETAGSTDSMDVVLLLERKLVVNDESDLLDINTSCEQIGGDQYSGCTSSELLHDGISLDLVHFTVHGGNCEVVLVHLFLQVEYSLLGVAVDQGLVDIKIGIEIKEDLDLPFFLLDSDVVLTDTLECQVLTLDQNLLWVAHEVLSQRQDVVGHGGREQGNLDVPWEELENILDLLFEASRQHFICFVHNEEPEVVGFEEAFLHHIVNTTWRTDDDVDSFLEKSDVFLDAGTADAGMDNDAHVLSDGLNNEGGLQGELTSWSHNEALNVVGGWVD